MCKINDKSNKNSKIKLIPTIDRIVKKNINKSLFKIRTKMGSDIKIL